MTITEEERRALDDREHATWTAAAPGWRKHEARLAASLRPVTERMLAAAAIGAGMRVLDIATGTGEPALAAAEQVGPRGYVLGTDFVEAMLAAARTQAARRGLAHVELRRVDGAELEARPRSFDAVLIRFGIMFMADPAACLHRARGALRPGGRIAVASWAAPAANPWLAVVASAIARHAGAGAGGVGAPLAGERAGGPGPFAFAEPERLRGALAAAGFADAVVEEIPLVPAGELADARAHAAFVFDLFPALGRLHAGLDPSARSRVDGEIARETERHRRGGRVALGGLALLAHGVR